ncbi:MAG: zinc-dependent metalloprotease family protein, partial [Bacteroidota bacterium]
MKNNCIKPLTSAVLAVAFVLAAGIFFSPAAVYASSNFKGQVFEKVEKMKAQNVFTKKTSAFAVASGASEQGLAAVLSHYTLLKKSADIESIKATKPEFISLPIPVDNGARSLNLLLYKVDISPNGFTLMSSDGQPHLKDNSIVHYRGIIDNNPRSVVSFTFSDDETMGLVCTENGNYVIGKLAQSPNDNYIIYNDRDMLARNNFTCGTLPVFPTNQSQYSPNGGGGNTVQTTKCVNWYWETDYDIFVDKGSVANVNTYMQAVFNQDAALYANDGITITLQTLYVWSTTDPYTGPGTGDYLNQFGNYRTSFAGDLAHLIGYNGGGGIAWVGGLCYGMPSGRQAYSAIYGTYSNVPAFSWTIECISHEEGHVLGSNHTHDCVWNGNNTAIDGCGPAAGYPGSSNGGNCVAGPIPTMGTIMSYCHLSPNPGIDLSLGFGIQPKTLIINAVNGASCLSACGQGCSTPAQPGTITGTTGVCQGASQTYSITAVSGATSYTWSYPGGWSGSSTSTSITVTAGATSGNISVTANNTCGASTARTLATTVTAFPAQPGNITGSASVCSGAAQAYSISAVSGATSYTWTKPSGWNGTSTSTSITAIAGTSGGNMSVVANNGCGSGNARSLAVTIATTPAQPGTITGSTSVCPSSSQTYSVTAVSGATAYNWTMPSGWTGSSTTNSITVAAGNSAGNISVSAGNGCGTSSVRTLAVTMGTAVPVQPGNISGNASVCPSTSQTYSITAVSGATSYTWTKPNGWSGTSTTNSISLTAGSTGGTLSVVANNGCGSSTARTLSLSMSIAPAQPGTITGSTSVCQSTSQTYSIAAVSGATGYTWTLPNGWSGSSTSTSITTTAGSSGGIISVIAVNGCGNSTARTLTTTISPTPAQPGNITGSTAVCQTSSQTYSITAVSGATSYTWTMPNGWTGTSTSTSITSTAGGAGGTISVVANNGCGSSSARTLSASVTPVPAQPASISGNSAACPGTSQTYSITAVSGATSYTWTLPGGWSGSSTSTSISPITGVAGGSITVKANNGCGSSSTASMTVSMSTAVPVQPGAISGSATVCQSTTQTYSVSAVSGASSYTWTKPNGWSGTSTTNSISLTSGSSGGTLSVTANNGCGSSTARTLSVSISGVGPAQPGAISGNASVCQSASQTYSIVAVNGATSYTWTLPNGWSGTSTSTSITSTIGSASGTISVTANNGCGSSIARTLAATVSVLPVQPGTITGSTSVCQTSSQIYSVTAVSGATSYTWTLPNGWTGTSASTSITATIGSAGGTISVKANSGCGSSSIRTLSASVSPVPVQPAAITGNVSICSATNQTYSITAVNGATSYTWTLPNGWSGSSTSTSINA